MGENASYQGQEIKIGTCENMYYLRADQAHLVTALPGNLDPVKRADAIRFRFPFPDEDHIAPGDFRDYGRTVTVRARAFDHRTDDCTSEEVHIVQQRVWEGRLVLVARCGGCGHLYRMPELADAGDVIEACASNAAAALAPEVTDAPAARWWLTIAQRIVAGYTEPLPFPVPAA